MGNILQKKMTRQTMINNLIFAHMIEKSCAKITHIAFFTMAETFQDRRCIVQRLDQLDFGNRKFLTGFQKNVPGNTGISETYSQSFGDFLASAIGPS
jgi:hypothetical protein